MLEVLAFTGFVLTISYIIQWHENKDKDDNNQEELSV